MLCNVSFFIKVSKHLNNSENTDIAIWYVWFVQKINHNYNLNVASVKQILIWEN